jgi:hypothetical protein
MEGNYFEAEKQEMRRFWYGGFHRGSPSEGKNYTEDKVITLRNKIVSVSTAMALLFMTSGSTH